MSPVTQKSAEGLPIFYLHDIPPVASGGPASHRAAHLFRAGPDCYVIVKGSTPEFDYPKGNDNVYATYDGADGVAVGGMAAKNPFRLVFRRPQHPAYQLHHRPRAVFCSVATSGIAFATIAPFLRLDRDPYVVVSDGRLFWIQDAYTTSNWFPYASRFRADGLNYIRNSVKIVIDAYNGRSTSILRMPRIRSSRPIGASFPGLFKSLEAMPAGSQEAHPLPRGPLSHPGAALPRLSHGRA